MRWIKEHGAEAVIALLAITGYVAPRPNGVDMQFSAEVRYRITIIASAAVAFILATIARDYIRLRRQVAQLHEWIFSTSHSGFSDALAKRNITNPQNIWSLRNLICRMIEWQNNGGRFPDEPKT